jgi:hypothetical protein
MKFTDIIPETQQLDELTDAQKYRIAQLNDVGQRMIDVNTTFNDAKKFNDKDTLLAAKSKLAQLAKLKASIESQPVDEDIEEVVTLDIYDQKIDSLETAIVKMKNQLANLQSPVTEGINMTSKQLSEELTRIKLTMLDCNKIIMQAKKDLDESLELEAREKLEELTHVKNQLEASITNESVGLTGPVDRKAGAKAFEKLIKKFPSLAPIYKKQAANLGIQLKTPRVTEVNAKAAKKAVLEYITRYPKLREKVLAEEGGRWAYNQFGEPKEVPVHAEVARIAANKNKYNNNVFNTGDEDTNVFSPNREESEIDENTDIINQYSTFAAWNLAVKHKGLRIEVHANSYGPDESDPYKTAYAVNKADDVLGCCTVHENGETEAVLFESPSEFESWMHQNDNQVDEGSDEDVMSSANLVSGPGARADEPKSRDDQMMDQHFKHSYPGKWNKENSVDQETKITEGENTRAQLDVTRLDRRELARLQDELENVGLVIGKDFFIKSGGPAWITYAAYDREPLEILMDYGVGEEELNEAPRDHAVSFNDDPLKTDIKWSIDHAKSKLSSSITYEDVKTAWLRVFPNSSVQVNKAALSKDAYTFKFRLAKDKTEVSSQIMDNDPLNYTGILENNTFKEWSGSMLVKPPVGSYLAFGSAKFMKKTIKDVTVEKLLKRFEQVKKFVSDHADELHNIKFDINDKLDSINESKIDNPWIGIGFDIRSTKLWPAEIFESKHPDFARWISAYRKNLTMPTAGKKCILAIAICDTSDITVLHGVAEYVGETNTDYILINSTGEHEYSKKDQLVFNSKKAFEHFTTMIALKFGESTLAVKQQPVMEAYGKPNKEAAKAKWMTEFEKSVTRLNSKLSGKIEWDSATYFFNSGKNPTDAAEQYVNSRLDESIPEEDFLGPDMTVDNDPVTSYPRKTVENYSDEELAIEWDKPSFPKKSGERNTYRNIDDDGDDYTEWSMRQGEMGRIGVIDEYTAQPGVLNPSSKKLDAMFAQQDKDYNERKGHNMIPNFKKDNKNLSDEEEIFYENATSGACSSGSVATVVAPLGATQRRTKKSKSTYANSDSNYKSSAIGQGIYESSVAEEETNCVMMDIAAACSRAYPDIEPDTYLIQYTNNNSELNIRLLDKACRINHNVDYHTYVNMFWQEQTASTALDEGIEKSDYDKYMDHYNYSHETKSKKKPQQKKPWDQKQKSETASDIIARRNLEKKLK